MVDSQDQRCRVVPVGGEGPIGILGIRGGKDPCQLGHLGRWITHSPTPGRTAGARAARSIIAGGMLLQRGAGVRRTPSGHIDALRPHTVEPGVAVVSSKELVAAISGQRDGDVLARHPADQIGRDLGDVGEGLVPYVRQTGDDLERLGIAHMDRRVVRPEVRWQPPPPRMTRRRNGSANPTVKVRTGLELCRCIRATIVLESIPPERNAPTGTSATILAATASDNAFSSSIGHLRVGAGQLVFSRRVPLPRLQTSSSVVREHARLGDSQRHHVTWEQFAHTLPDGVRCGDAVAAEVTASRLGD